MAQKINQPLQATQPNGETRELLEPMHQTKKQKWATYLVGFALGLSAVAIGVLVYWGLSGKDVLQIKNEPLPVKPAFLKREEFITVNIDFCKVSKAQGTVYTRFVSARTELVVPTYQENLGVGCKDNFAFKVPIPPQLTPDTYHLNYRIDYRTNPLTSVREEFNTQNFTVTE
jgi:hypothetical protein